MTLEELHRRLGDIICFEGLKKDAKVCVVLDQALVTSEGQLVTTRDPVPIKHLVINPKTNTLTLVPQ